ncbi:MAG TPA: CsbD family protein, partial [Hyphomicrobiaceae bacterium]
MNWDRIEGNWKQFTGKVKEKWGDLTDDDLTSINGRRDQLEGKLQERYGYTKDQVKKEV